jgi:hypothetical protein
LLHLHSVLFHPPVTLWLVGSAVIGEVTEDMLLALVDDGLLDTSEAIDLQAVLGEGAGLIKDHHVHSSRDVDTRRRNTVDLMFSQPADCKGGACCHSSWECWWDSDSDEV